jgi:N-acetylglutamate synthase-like GNAT family acetyltransferase
VPVTIRDAQRDDADSIARLLGQLGYPTPADAIPARLDRLDAAHDRVVVAELDDRIVGLAHLHVSPTLEDDAPAAKLGALVVEAACRGLGVGHALLDALQREARARGCGVFFLTTSERRDDAHAFYERLGLELTGRRYAVRLN